MSRLCFLFAGTVQKVLLLESETFEMAYTTSQCQCAALFIIPRTSRTSSTSKSTSMTSLEKVLRGYEVKGGQKERITRSSLHCPL